jgi:hypothetical protein
MELKKYDVVELPENFQRNESGGLFFLIGTIGYAINTTLVAGTVAAVSGAVAYSFESGRNIACKCI